MTRLLLLLVVSAAAGCASISREEMQTVDVRVYDLDGHQVDATCRIANGGQVVVGNAPMYHVPVPRSGSDMQIECQCPGMPPARAVAVSRSSSTLMIVVQPIASTLIDHLTGRMYDYPQHMSLTLGRDMVFDRRREDDQPVSSRPVPVSQVAAQPAAIDTH